MLAGLDAPVYVLQNRRDAALNAQIRCFQNRLLGHCSFSSSITCVSLAQRAAMQKPRLPALCEDYWRGRTEFIRAVLVCVHTNLRRPYENRPSLDHEIAGFDVAEEPVR